MNVEENFVEPVYVSDPISNFPDKHILSCKDFFLHQFMENITKSK